LIEIYTKKNPLPLALKVGELLTKLKGPLSKEAIVEGSFLIERLYSLEASEALKLFNEILDGDQPWQTQFLALAYLEWAIHRNKLSEEQLLFLHPTLKFLAQRNIAEVNEKLMTILTKLNPIRRYRKLFTLLRENL